MIPETVRITFLQRALEKNHGLRQNPVLDSVWRSKTGSTGQFTFEVYDDLLLNAAYQHDLNNAAGQKKSQTVISYQVDSFDESDHDPGEDTQLDQGEDDSSSYSIFQSSRFLSLTNFGESFLSLQRSLSLSTTRQLKLLSPNHTSMVAILTIMLLWGNPIHSPSKSTFMRIPILLKNFILKVLIKLWFMSV